VSGRPENGWREPPRGSVGLDPGLLRDVGRRDIAVRFAFGAGTSVVAGLLTLAFGPRVGGTMLAFPAILAASLTLIEDEDGAADAREDARGALVGALGLGAFAAVAAVLLQDVSAVAAVALAGAAWAIVALAGYALAWGRGRRGSDR
jgi:hypothetical protein